MATSRNKIRLKKDTYIQTDWCEEWNGNSIHKCEYNNNNNNTVNIVGSKNGQCVWSRNNNKVSDQLWKNSFQSGSVCDNKKHLSSYSVISNYNNNVIGRNNSNISNINNNNSNINNNSNSNRSINKHLNNKSKLSLTYRNCVSFTNITNTNTNSVNESNYKHFQLKSFKPLYYTKSNINIKQHNTTTKPYIIDKKYTKNILTPYKFRNIMKDMLKRSFSRNKHKQPLKSINNALPELNSDTYVNPYKDMDINSEYKRKGIDDDIQLTLKNELKRAKDIVEFKRKYHSRNNGKGKKCNGNNVKYVSLFKSNTKENTNNGFKDYFTFETPFMQLNRELKQSELIKDQNVVSQLFINNFKKFK